MNDEEYAAILELDFSDEFVELMKERVVHGFKKWVPFAALRVGDRKSVTKEYTNDVIRLMKAYGSSGKPYLLGDAANYIMFLYKRSQKETAT